MLSQKCQVIVLPRFSGLFGFRGGRGGQRGQCPPLGLQRFEGIEGAEQLGQRRAAVAHQRVERAGAAVPHQPEAECCLRAPTEQPGPLQMAIEHGGLEAIDAAGAPGGDDDARDQIGLQGALGRKLLVQRGLEGAERRGILVDEQHHAPRAKAVLGGVAGNAGPAGGGVGSARLRAVAPAGRRPRGGDFWHGG